MATNTPLISVIVPIYNVEQYLCRCVDSILVQSHQNLEVILVDDGSPDGCPQICDDYARKDGRIRVIHKPNGGLSDARNWGLEIATGDYIGFVDSDDWIAPDMFEYLLRGIEENAADISYCEVIKVYKWTQDYPVRKEDIVLSCEEALDELYSDRLENYAWNKLYKAELWKDVKYPVGLNFEDIATIYKTFEKANRVVVLPEPKYYYDIRPDSISGTKDFKFKYHIYQAIVRRYNDAAPRTPQFKAQLSRRVVLWYVHQLSIQFRDHPENDLKNMAMLDVLAPFVRDNYNDIVEAWKMGRLERKKLAAFAEGTPEGCLRSLKYHYSMKRRERVRSLLTGKRK